LVIKLSNARVSSHGLFYARFTPRLNGEMENWIIGIFESQRICYNAYRL